MKIPDKIEYYVEIKTKTGWESHSMLNDENIKVCKETGGEYRIIKQTITREIVNAGPNQNKPNQVLERVERDKATFIRKA